MIGMAGRLAWLLLAAAVAGAQPSPLLTIEPNTPDTLRFEAPLPDFAARDTTGKLWRSADLTGKLTVVDIWRSQGGPNPEHEELQRFYDEVRNRKNLQVLTFCVDYDYTHAAAYMQQRNYTFPVIADWEVARKLFGKPGNLARAFQWPGWENEPAPTADRRPWRFPQVWVINAEGRLSARFAYWTLSQILTEVE